jgi:hypothetical protein
MNYEIAQAVLFGLLGFLVFRVLQTRFRTHKDHVSAKVQDDAWYKKETASEDANARYRFTESRMKKALAALAAHRKETKATSKGADFDVILIGSG